MYLYIGGRNQGKYKLVSSQYPEQKIWNSFHMYIRDKFETGCTKEEILIEVRKEIIKYPDLIIISDEVGNGIVPIEKKEREYRDLVGEILQVIAKEAEKVVRVTCSIPQQIK